jgi:transposase
MCLKADAVGAIVRRNTVRRRRFANRFVRGTERGLWDTRFRGLAARERSAEAEMIDSTHVKAHRSAWGDAKGRLLFLQAGAMCMTAGRETSNPRNQAVEELLGDRGLRQCEAA